MDYVGDLANVVPTRSFNSASHASRIVRWPWAFRRVDVTYFWSGSSRTSKIEAPATRLTQDRKREAKWIPAQPFAESAFTVRTLISRALSNEIPMIPKLARLERFDPVVLPKIMSALSISEPYASRIRGGRCVPHTRDWRTLATLVGILNG